MTVTREADADPLDTEADRPPTEVDDGKPEDGSPERRWRRWRPRTWPRRLAPGSTNPLGRGALAAIGLGFLVVTFAQSPGLIEFDTKLPLVAGPIHYFSSLLHLWDPNVFGGIVEQRTGFLWPMGVFFLVAHAVGIPVWIAQRLWLAMILTVACWGVIRLAESLGLGTRWSRILGGIVYCSAPLVVTYVSTSGDILPAAFLPWMLQPLVRGSQSGSVRQAAARSGVAVAFMGGVNAAVTLAVLPVGVIWLLTRQAGPRRRSLTVWWLLAVGLACFWWIVPLLFVGHLAYSYLPYSETSSLTTSTTSAFEAIRGASFWVTYYNVGSPVLRGAWLLVSVPIVIFASAAVVATGLFGLCRKIPERLFLVTTFTFGVVVIACGYSGAMGGLFSHTIQNLLQGSLAPFRNASKFAPDVALPLALGFVAAAATVWQSPISGVRKLVVARNIRVALTTFLIAAVLVAAAPFWRGELYRSGGFNTFPLYWYQAAKYLNTHQGHDNALLVPGSSFGHYTWGDPIDEPLQVLGTTPLLWRDVVTLGSNGNIQLVDAVEQSLDSGISTPGLTEYLSRAGVKFVVERNDLNLKQSGAPPPAQVHQVLSETPGLTEVASFGHYLSRHQVQLGSLPVYDSRSYLHLRPVEIFRVDSSVSPVASYPAKDPVVLSGQVGSVMSLSAAGVLKDRASVLSGDSNADNASASADATWAITDGNQRVVTQFGRIRYNQSYVLSAHQQLPGRTTGIPNSFVVVNGDQHQAVEAPIGAQSVSASSFGSIGLKSDPSEGPAAAFDNNLETAWTASNVNDSIGQWVSISFAKPIRMSAIDLTPIPGSSRQRSITKVELITDRGSVLRTLSPGDSKYHLSLTSGPSRHLKIVIVAVHSVATPPAGGIVLSAGIENVSIPGVSLEQRILLPNDESKVFSKGTSNGSVVAFSRSLTNENLTLGKFSTDDPDMRREFTLPKKATATAVGTAIPQPGTGVDNLISFFSPVPKAAYTVTASSSLGSLPKFSPQNLVETDSKAPWIANIGDQQPWINLQWGHKRAVSSVKLTPTGTASTPTQVAITPLGGPTVVRSVPAKDGVLTFPETLTDSIKIQILRSEGHLSVTPSLGVGVPLPAGLSAISVPGLLTSAYRYHGPNLNEQFRLTCGDGPRITLDGKSYDTSVAGTVGDLVNLRPVAVTLCTPNDGLALESGVHNFASSDGEFLMTSFVMQPEHPVSAANITKRSASLVDWAAESRKVHVGAGPATYIVLPQNFSAGWVARFGDQELKSVRIDGWEQGFVVPGGKAGTVTMDMQPNGIYEVLLIIGGLLLLALIVLALFPARRKPPYPEVGSAKPSFWLLLGLSAVALLLVAGPWALALVPLLAFARHWGRIPMAAAAFFAFIVAGVISAIHPATLNAKTAAAFTAPVQLASVAALAAVLTALVADNWPQGASVEEGHAALATGVGDEVTSNLSSEAVDESGGSE